MIFPTIGTFWLWPVDDGDLAARMQREAITHVRRWHLRRSSVSKQAVAPMPLSRAGETPCNTA